MRISSINMQMKNELCDRMNWKEDRFEHARIWKSATFKALHNIDKAKLRFAHEIFEHDYGFLINILGEMDNPSQEEKEDGITSVFITWLFSAFRKMSAGEDWVKINQDNLTKDEKDVLDAALKSRFDLFKVEEARDGQLNITNADGSDFTVDVIDLDLNVIKKGEVFFSMIGSKADNKYFLPSRLLTMNRDMFTKYAEHRKFRNSWPDYLSSFYKYQVEEGLSERTADKHTENVDLMLSYLEDKFIFSFKDVTKAMLKTGLKAFVKHKIWNRVDIDKVYYSLYKFFDYLAEERGIKNIEVIRWLRQII